MVTEGGASAAVATEMRVDTRILMPIRTAPKAFFVIRLRLTLFRYFPIGGLSKRESSTSVEFSSFNSPFHFFLLLFI